MTFDELEVGRAFYANYRGEPLLLSCQEYQSWHYAAGEKYIKTLDGCSLRPDDITDIRQVPTQEELEKLVEALRSSALLERGCDCGEVWSPPCGKCQRIIAARTEAQEALAAAGEG